jgi:uncharacterized protein (TIGR01777 family)
MKFLVTGGTGFIGSALCQTIIDDDHRVIVKTRQPNFVHNSVTTITHYDQLSKNEEIDVVINLAGEPIANKRWSENQKKKILQSRLDATSDLLDFLKEQSTKPKVLINGSAIGYYGIHSSDEPLNEDALSDDSFSSYVCQKWEAAALNAENMGIRTCLLRIGLVIGKNGGALRKMLPAFKLGLGGKLGHGNQWMSWIHIEDLIRILMFCIEQKNLNGPINCTAPVPVTNKKFTLALEVAVRRPAIIPMPAALIKIGLGQMGDELLLSGRKVMPTKLVENGFEFSFTNIEEALLSAI